MPHSGGVGQSWASLEPRWLTGGRHAKGEYINRDNQRTPVRRRSSLQQRHARARSLPIISEQDENAPPPAEKSTQKQVTISVKPVNKAGIVMRPLSIAPPSLLSRLPCMPTPTYNSRHELQRRVSPTALTFGPTFPASPPLTPLTPVTPVSATFSTSTRNTYKSTPIMATVPIEEEPVYVLTLRTSDDIAQTMQTLRKRWFPAERLKVPAHITLFHALPESRLREIEDHINEMKRSTPRFEVCTGRVMRMRQGVLVNLEEGDWDVRQLYGRMRSTFYDWLSEQDKSCKAHYTIQNKEVDQDRVDEAFQDTFRAGPVLGWATGLVLWKYNDGHWLKEKEFDFEGNSRHRSLSPPQSVSSSRRVSR